MSHATTLVLLFVNKECNLNCDYCFVKKFPSKFCPEKVILPSTFDKIMILGGEPGLLTLDEIKILFDILSKYNKPICLSTNGLFIEKYYEQFPNLIYIHHNATLQQIYDKPNIKNLLVVTSKNIDQIYNFVTSHPNIQFGLNENMFEHLITIPIVNKKYLKLLALPNITKNSNPQKSSNSNSITVFVDAYKRTI